MSDDKLIEALNQLSITVKKMIDEGITNGTIKPQDEVYFRWKVDKFQYTDKGVTNFSAQGDYATEKSWFGTIIELQQAINNCSQYSLSLEHLTRVFGGQDRMTSNLDRFVIRLLRLHLPDPEFEDRGIDTESMITTFLKDLREEPVKYGADVELQGLALQPESIDLGFGVVLRQTIIKDLERRSHVYGFSNPYTLHTPSAILHIEFLGRAANEISRRVEQATAILRLFKAGSVRHTVYHMKTESITDPVASGTIASSQMIGALETYLITHQDTQGLKKFWRTMIEFLPKSFFEPDTAATDYLTIAYKRYTDALLENGLIERRIANAVMGLEALFLKSGEHQELLYRLGVRTGKIFALLGQDQHQMKRALNDAYKIRNIFAHGGQLSYERRKKLETKYADVKNLLLSVLNCLRVSILILTLSKKEKNELVDLIDDSLIDEKREQQLERLVSQAKELIG